MVQLFKGTFYNEKQKNNLNSIFSTYIIHKIESEKTLRCIISIIKRRHILLMYFIH